MSERIWNTFSTMLDGMVRSLEALSVPIQGNERERESSGSQVHNDEEET